MMVALSTGGAILGVFLHVSNILLDETGPMPQGFKILYDIAIPTVAGGVLGSIEGMHSSLPLAWLLGMFGDRMTERADSRG
jgi:hypothetical protein